MPTSEWVKIFAFGYKMMICHKNSLHNHDLVIVSNSSKPTCYTFIDKYIVHKLVATKAKGSHKVQQQKKESKVYSVLFTKIIGV